MTAAEKPHLSIGEVLGLLRDEFDDITVSKIRFLESQGLINPERTLSGYRKFYEPDVERLRWILRQQRENYLPLKVIKGRLGQVGSEPGGPNAADLPSGGGAEPGTAHHVRSLADASADPTAPSLSGAIFSRQELMRAAGLDEHQMAELEEYSILPRPREVGRNMLYDEDALEVARIARGFFRHGVEARHLKMYKSGAEREAEVIMQRVAPVLKQRNPVARSQAHTTVSELATLGQALRAVLMRMTLSRTFPE